MATVREVVLDLLRDLGMTTIFGNPGSTELPLLKDFPEDFHYVLALQEASAVGMAEGYAQGVDNAAFVNLHTAPGLGNAMGAMVTAYLDKTPLIVTAGQQDRRHMALEPLLSGKLVDLAQPYVKRSYEPPRAEDVPFEILRAYHTAMQHPRGPVFLSIPMDDWDAEVEPLPPRSVAHRVGPDPEALAKMAQGLADAARIALVVGPGVSRARAFDEVVEVAERLGAAVFQDAVSALAGFPQRHPLFHGFLRLAQGPVAEQLAPYDAVLVLGTPVFTYYPYIPGPTVREGTKVFQITDDPEEAARAAVGESVFADLALGARDLAALLPDEKREAPATPDAPPVPEASSPMSVAFVMNAISEALPDDAVVVDESTSSKGVLHQYVRVDSADGYHTSAAGGLGFCMPATVGLKLALPDRVVACVIGDGSSMYSIQALWTAAQESLAVPFIVINNSGYSILKAFRDTIGISNVPGLDLPGIDHVRIAEGLGCTGERVEDPQDLNAALKRALTADGPYLLDVAVDPTVPSLLR
jgi:benzoylformate decarboxylase